MELKDYIKTYRKSHGLSMEQFAKLASLSKGYISMLEKGQNPQSKKKIVPSITVLNNIAVAMNTDLSSLLDVVDDLEVSLEAPSAAPPPFELTDDEKTLVTKYRKLTPTNKTVIDSNIDFMLYQQELDVQKEGLCSAS